MPRVGKARRSSRTEEKNTKVANYYQSVATRLNKKLGADTLVNIEEDERIFSTVKGYVSTQCYGLDFAMHLPGLPVGRVVCIRGDFMSAKSTIAQHVMAETQRLGGVAVLIDTEYAWDKSRALAIGMQVNQDKFLMPQVDTLEEAIQVIDECIDVAREEQDAGNSRLVTIVWDSVGESVPKGELDANFGDSRPGLHARLMSAALRRITKRIAEHRILLVLIGQEKDRVDFFSMGGQATKTMLAEKPIMFHSSVVLRPQLMQKLTNSNKEPTGIRIKITVMKNKLAAPFSKAEAIVGFANGIDSAASVLAVALQYKIVGKAGSWYSYQGQKFRESDFATLLTDHSEIMDRLEVIKRNVSNHAPVDASDDGASEDDDDFEEEESEEEDDGT